MKSDSDAVLDVPAVSSIRGILSSATHYDLLLAAIPLAFATALLADLVVPIPREFLFLAASTVGLLAIADGVFRRPPRPRRGPA